MAGGIAVFLDLSQINKLAVDLGEAGVKAVPLASAAVGKTALAIEADAKAFCPVDTGNLRSSISTTHRALEAEIGPTAEYGVYVELGTSVMAPQAYLGPAFDRHAGDLLDALGLIVETAL